MAGTPGFRSNEVCILILDLVPRACPWVSTYFQGGYGLVEYVNLNRGSGNIGLFRKDNRYFWQREFRFILGVRDEALNSNGAFELQIGDLSDISKISSVESYIQNPIKISRRFVKKVGNEYIDVEPEG